MEEDCEVYVDPEEDEVFFGSITEREEDLYSKLAKNAGLTPRPKGNFKLVDYVCGDVNNKNVDGIIIKNSEGIVGNENSEIQCSESENTQDFYSFYSDPSVELEHNYSTPMKNKIDKTILSTPKSIVKADRDGGFLKVLSEIALVKAEADADKKITDNKKEDEDKENQFIPEIRIIEATPEKVNVISPPKTSNKQLRRFRIIYNSPNNEENLDSSKPVNMKSESFEISQNLKNKSLDYDPKVMGNVLNNDKRKSVEFGNQSIDLIDLSKSDVTYEKESEEEVAEKVDGGVWVSSCESQSLKHNNNIELQTQQEEHELILVDNKESTEAIESLKETAEIEKEEWKLVLVESQDCNKMEQSPKEKVEVQKEKLVLTESKDSKEVDQSVQTQKEECELILVGNKDSDKVDESLKETVEPEKEKHELILLDNKNSNEVDGSLKAVEAEKEKCELILVESQNSNKMELSKIEMVEAQKKENKIGDFSELVGNGKEEPELILSNEEDNLVGERTESSDKALYANEESRIEAQINPETNSVRKLEVIEEDRKFEEPLSDDPIPDSGENKQNIVPPTTAEPVKPSENPESASQTAEQQVQKIPECRRFSKDARMIVDVLKKYTIDDTFNFTIPEIDAENSFLCPEPVSCFDDTLVPKETTETPKRTPRSGKSSPRLLLPPGECKSARKPATAEKELHNLTPSLLRQPVKYFSERKIYNNNGSGFKDRIKMLPIQEVKRTRSEENIKGVKSADKGPSAVPSSKIPVFGIKSCKLPTSERVGRFATTRTTPLKTPSAKPYRNPRFNNIESPINAYITNKPTSLVLNVKPEVKKDSVNKMWKSQTSASGKKIPAERGTKIQTPKPPPRLPFVEYRSATPYKVEKKSESKLPRLAPNVQKLIGSHSPRVLKHEGRFYLKTPTKPTPVEDTTIVADPNEVSVLVCQTAQKSNTIK